VVVVNRLLEIRDLRTYFELRRDTVKAVDGVSFALSPGEIVGVVGESGSGKSVTMLSMLGLIQPPGRIVSGEAIFEGRDLLKLSERELNQTVRGKKISIIFQNPVSCLNPVLRVSTQITRVYRTHKPVSARQARERALEFLKLAQIPDPERVMNAYPHQLSGGMAQRVMIAMALICEPNLLIADEPTTGLDVTVQGQILNLMRDLRDKTEAAQLLITHDLGVVAETCDRIIIMYCGKIMEIGTAEEIFRDPLHPYTAALLRSVPDARKDFAATTIPGRVPDPREPPPGCRFHPRCSHAVEACWQKEPALLTNPAGRDVACHLQAEGRLGDLMARSNYSTPESR
jgi:oligopeptide/dipeptide ABC transporter ATP-binding protein